MVTVGEFVVTYTGIIGVVEKIYSKNGKDYCVIRSEDGVQHHCRITEFLMGGGIR